MFFLFLLENINYGTDTNCHFEELLMSIHSVCFPGEIRKRHFLVE